MAVDRRKLRALEEALDLALTEHGIDSSYRATVRNLVHDTDDRWRVCCGSSCEPCVEQVARVVDQVRALIGVSK